jgi:plastocyanin
LLALFSFVAQADQLVDVRIEGYTYQPAEVTIRVGDSVRWTNHEKRTSHSVLFPREGGLESERMFPQESWQRRFEKPGRYDYHCGPHPEMKGVVVVGE